MQTSQRGSHISVLFFLFFFGLIEFVGGAEVFVRALEFPDLAKALTLCHSRVFGVEILAVAAVAHLVLGGTVVGLYDGVGLVLLVDAFVGQSFRHLHLWLEQTALGLGLAWWFAKQPNHYGRAFHFLGPYLPGVGFFFFPYMVILQKEDPRALWAGGSERGLKDWREEDALIRGKS